MSWRQELDALLPPDRADSAPITHHLRGLLEALHNGQGERPRITITLEADAWTMLEAQFRRPYRPHSSYTVVALDVGMVAFERRKDEPRAQQAPAFAWVCVCGLGWPDTSPWECSSCPSCGHEVPPPPRKTTAPSDAPWPEGPFPRPIPNPMCEPPGGGRFELIPREQMGAPLAEPVIIRNQSWDAAAIEAKAAALATTADTTRPDGAIYTAPMTGAEATYGGPWKEPK